MYFNCFRTVTSPVLPPSHPVKLNIREYHINSTTIIMFIKMAVWLFFPVLASRYTGCISKSIHRIIMLCVIKSWNKYRVKLLPIYATKYLTSIYRKIRFLIVIIWGQPLPAPIILKQSMNLNYCVTNFLLPKFWSLATGIQTFQDKMHKLFVFMSSSVLAHCICAGTILNPNKHTHMKVTVWDTNPALITL